MAIAFDAASTWTTGATVSSINFSHTVGNGSNTLLLVLSLTTNNDASATYNGVAMTNILSKVGTGADGRTLTLFGLLSPTQGANTVVISTVGTSAVLQGGGSSYSGVAQTLTPDATTTNLTVSSVTTLSTSLTTIANNCWIVLGARFVAGANGITGGTNTTLRTNSATTGFGDTNAAITPPALTSMVVNDSNGSGGAYSLMASFAPAVPPTGSQSSGSLNNLSDLSMLGFNKIHK